MSIDYTSVTEISGDEITKEQLERMAHRYLWAMSFCQGRDVLEIACGSGQGLGLLNSRARSLVAGDIMPSLVSKARYYYGDTIDIRVMNATNMPFPNSCLDIIIFFEAIYYLPNATIFMEECRRILRPNGKLLIVTSNKDLFDFNPSPYSHRYYGTREMSVLCRNSGFECNISGYLAVSSVSMRQRFFRPIKSLGVKLKVIPSTMRSKRLLKRLVFGGLTPMPSELDESMVDYEPPISLAEDKPNTNFKVIYCEATLRGN